MKRIRLAFALILFSVSALAQTARRTASFEAVSVKPNTLPGAGGPFGSVGVCAGGRPQIDPRRFAATATVYVLISWAYGRDCANSEQHNLLTGGPNWVRKDLFAIQAVVPEGSPSYSMLQLFDGQAPNLQAMIQTLLADRFKLKIHSESRVMPVYVLKVDRNGSKLQPFEEGSCDFPTGPQPQSEKLDQKRPWCSFGVETIPDRTARRVRIAADGVTLEKFAQLLSLDLDSPVIDQTGIPGKFAFRVIYASARPTGVQPDIGTAQATDATLSTALREQLGLRLESARGPVEVLVVDSVERPSEN